MDEPITPLTPLLEHLDRADPGDVVGVYLYGSARTSGLRPDSDIDLLLLTHRSLTAPERAALVSLLLRVSGWRGHAERFPDAVHRRPIELTSIVTGGLRPLTDTPRRDFQYGEWLRARSAPAGSSPRTPPPRRSRRHSRRPTALSWSVPGTTISAVSARAPMTGPVSPRG